MNQTDGARALPCDRDVLGRVVREAWVRWALAQPNPKASWLVPYDELGEADKEADRQIGESVGRFVLLGDAARASMQEECAWCYDFADCVLDGDPVCKGCFDELTEKDQADG